ncbi:DUF1566 domain-containing protein [Hydrogenophaga sp. RWCD_12]|uniref:DUF1566 domain-containing protein n=1 Tax=Hydrogenophaga sp. RWCD_12 TaxID=3391190 RepID=UPI0039848BC6
MNDTMNAPAPSHAPFLTLWSAIFACSFLLAACGGSQDSGGQASASVARTEAIGTSTGVLPSFRSAAPTEETVALQEEGARLNSEELAQIARTGVLAKALESKLISGATTKVAATRIPVYRFFNTRTGAHFYTTSESEKASVLATMPFMTYDGPAFAAASAFSPGLSPVHRFFNTRTGVHFYTINEAERASIAATMPYYSYEGVAYHASQVTGQGFTPLYRFFVPARGYHFYTSSLAEKQNLQTTLSGTYNYEGVGYHVLASNWRAEKLPHTGVTGSQCYREGDNAMVACSGIAIAAALLNSQQDGHRTAINPMSYSEVVYLPGGTFGPINYSRTSCVRDNVTGLVWEGKTDDGGARDKDNTYTNLGNNAVTDASGYVAAVNAGNLCGFNDWRLPSVLELQTIVDYGKPVVGPSIDTTWFPNTAPTFYASSDLSGATDMQVYFWGDGGWTYLGPRSEAKSVRLVRGSMLSGPRYSPGTVAYAGDAANNLVNDALSGLQWRRCVEGMSWTGSGCVGTPQAFTHEEALVHARNQTGWRLPNIKELGSLVDRSVTSGTRIDSLAFPQAPQRLWTSSPYVGNPVGAWVVQFANGALGSELRSFRNAVRLVRTNP